MEKIKLNELLTKDLRGKVVVFPTDTVYGIGALYDDLDSIKRIYEIKGRSFEKPLALLIPSNDISNFVSEINDSAKEYIDMWPGALTIIFKRSDKVDPSLVMGKDTIALRNPDSFVSLTILKHFGAMAVTSINRSGEKELNNIADIEKEFGEKIDYLVIDEEQFSSHPSKIIDASGSEIKVIRS